jgi:hypothetical protein
VIYIYSPLVFFLKGEKCLLKGGKKRVQEVFTKRHITQSEKIPIRERIEGGIEIVFFIYSF